MKKSNTNSMKYKVLLALIISLFSFDLFAQTEKEKVMETTFKSKIEGHIHFLASDELKGREVGTPEIDIAAKYIATSFMKYGVKPIEGSYFQNVPFNKHIPPSAYSAEVNGQLINNDMLMLLAGDDINYQGGFVFIGYGSEEEIASKEVKGKLVISMAGNKEKQDMRSAMAAYRNKMKSLKDAGAAGMIELFDEMPAQWQSYRGYFSHASMKIANESKAEMEKDKFFSLWAIDTDGEVENSFKLKMRKAKVIISEAQNLTVYSKNVVGMVEGTDPSLKEEFIIYSAHYDHNGVGAPNQEGDSIYNGARDNAVGVVTVMSAAENIAKYPTKRSALFILFTAEEKGLLGSRYYVENPLLPLKDMVYCFNSDNGGYNDTSIATVVGLGRTTAEKHIVGSAVDFGLKVIDDPAGEQGLFDRSDNVNFAKKGIPAPTYSMGFTAFDEEIFKYYHQTRDNPESIDYDYLEKFFRSYVLACRLIANDAVTPFWTEGDKYYQAGKDLYQKK